MPSDRLSRKSPISGLLDRIPDEVITPGRMRINTSGEKEAAKHAYSRTGTAQDFRRAYIIGSGDIGAAVHGTPDNYTYHICKNDLWWDDFDSDPPCYIEGGIDELRRRISEGDPTLKQDIFAASNRRNNNPTQTSAARLTLHLISGGVQGHIKEKMELHSGVVEQTYGCGDQNGIILGNDFRTVSCISPAEDVMLIMCEASSRAGHMGKMSLELTKDPMEVSNNSGHLTDGEKARLEKEIEEYYTPVPFTDGEDFGFNMRLRAGHDPENSPDIHYTVRMRSSDKNFKIYSAGSKIIAEGRPEGKTVCFILTIATVFDTDDTMAETKRRLDVVSAYHMPMVISNCVEWYRHIWKRSWIRLPDVKYSRPWYWGVYQAMASRKPGKQPAGYLAPWYQSSLASWGHHILTYEQAKTNLGILPTNHAELLEPWFSLLVNSREKLVKFTKDFYHLNGTAYPHSISNSGTVIASAINLNGTMMNLQTAGESVKYCWDYFDCTGDTEFLRKTGYPVLRDAATFYHEYLLTDEKSGEKYIFPSRSQEFVNTIGLSNEFMTDSLIDVCMFRNTLDKAAKAAEILGVDGDLVKLWREDTAAMRKGYAVWPDGTWKTAADTDDRTLDYGPPGVTDVAPVCYTGEVDARHGDTPGIMEAARKTVMKLIPGDEIPWDRSFGIIARLRMRDSEYAGRILRFIPEQYEIGGNLEDPIDPECDYSVGKGTAATAQVISEMLFQSQGGVLQFFPAWDKSIGDASFYSLRGCGAFLAGAEMRNGEFAYAIIRSIAGNDCRIVPPVQNNLRIRDLETGEAVSFETEDDTVKFSTLAGHEYAVESADAPLESFPVID
ncbi:MAG: glycoside hydrolase N-terminal domain-containing protein [Clostridia bacterium]|nr:glycoside hydrolase N-terminal domain-containing protein [Clostridia bacterium]